MGLESFDMCFEHEIFPGLFTVDRVRNSDVRARISYPCFQVLQGKQFAVKCKQAIKGNLPARSALLTPEQMVFICNATKVVNSLSNVLLLENAT